MRSKKEEKYNYFSAFYFRNEKFSYLLLVYEKVNFKHYKD